MNNINKLKYYSFIKSWQLTGLVANCKKRLIAELSPKTLHLRWFEENVTFAVVGS